MSTVGNRAGHRGILMMITCAVMWSIAGVLIKLIPWDPLVIAGFRSLIAGGVIAVYMKMRRIRVRINRSSVMGGIALCATILLYVPANRMISPANANVLMFTAPVFLMLISALVYRQRFFRRDIITLLVTVGGIILCFVDQIEPGSLLGNLLALTSGFTMAIMYTATGNTDFDSRITGILLAQVFTALCGIPQVLVSDTPVTPGAVGGIVLMGVVQLGIPYLLYGMAVTHCPPFLCSLLAAAEPLLTPVWVYLATRELPGPFALLGCAVVIAAITVYNIVLTRATVVPVADDGETPVT